MVPFSKSFHNISYLLVKKEKENSVLFSPSLVAILLVC